MRKIMVLFTILSSMMLSACSFLDQATNSLEYVNQATEYINKLSGFAEQAPQMIKDAAVNPEAKQELENQLNALKTEIQQFIKIEPPSIAKDIHQELVNKSEILLQEINKMVENGHLALDKLENSQLLTTINNIADLLNRINNLGL